MTAALLLCTTASAKPESENTVSDTVSIKYDFTNDDAGFVPIFADYPADDNSDEFYELYYSRSDIPIDNAGKGLFISGNNHSDDLFMGYYKELSGLNPGKNYIVNISFKIATNVDGGLIGIGGSPGSSVYVKCGITSQKPTAVKSDTNQYRLNIDKGNQATDGKDMKTAGTIEKQETMLFGKYEFNDYNISVEAAANQDGNAYLIIGTDSGFEGTTSYYIKNADLQMTVKDEAAYDEQFEQAVKDAAAIGIIENTDYDKNEEVTRLQFCEFAYNMLSSVKELPVAKLSRNPFDDINNPKITREEAAVILYRIAKYTETEIPDVKVDMSYSDNDEISDWAIYPAYSMKVLNVMSDSSGELFNPKANYTFKESLISLVKLYNFIKGN